MNAQKELVGKYMELQKDSEALDVEWERLRARKRDITKKQEELEKVYAEKILKYKVGDLFRDKAGRKITITEARISVDVDKGKASVYKVYQIMGDCQSHSRQREEKLLDKLIEEGTYKPITDKDWTLPKSARIGWCKQIGYDEDKSQRTLLLMTKKGIYVKATIWDRWPPPAEGDKLLIVRKNTNAKLYKIFSDGSRSEIADLDIKLVFANTGEAVEELL